MKHKQNTVKEDTRISDQMDRLQRKITHDTADCLRLPEEAVVRANFDGDFGM